MLIMVANLGSTSYKFKLLDLAEEERTLASGGMESIGKAMSAYEYGAKRAEETGTARCTTHADAFRFFIDLMKQDGVLESLNSLDCVAYKAVHGGALSGAQIVDDAVLGAMDALIPLAPAHNPIYLSAMRALQKEHPGLVQIACFETAYHGTIPEKRVVYGVPYEWVERYGVRRYGFHGASHSYIADELSKRDPGARRILSAHLGGSSSLCAIKEGKSIANTFGATLQSGLFHNNRVGDFDGFCLPMLADAHENGLQGVLEDLSKNSGFLGVSGVSNDLREVIAAAEMGNARAQLAVDAFVDNIVGTIGMYTAYLGGLDALVFTGGIGTHSAVIREKVCAALSFLPCVLDERANANAQAERIDADGSAVRIYKLKTNEELMVARAAKARLERG